MTYTEDQVVEDEEDKGKEAGESETETPVTETESGSKDEGASCAPPVCFVLMRVSLLRFGYTPF